MNETVLFENSVRDLLIREYKHDLKEAEQYLKLYEFYGKVVRNPDYYFHNSASFWALYIHNYYSNDKILSFPFSNSRCLSVLELKEMLKQKNN